MRRQRSLVGDDFVGELFVLGSSRTKARITRIARVAKRNCTLAGADRNAQTATAD